MLTIYNLKLEGFMNIYEKQQIEEENKLMIYLSPYLITRISPILAHVSIPIRKYPHHSERVYNTPIQINVLQKKKNVFEGHLKLLYLNITKRCLYMKS